jgi:hypothetical protein
MEITFAIQDPTNADTTYLYEAIVSAIHGATNWRGLYAFATRGAVDHLIAEKATEELLKSKGRIDLVVGIDAITNKATLERLRLLEKEHKPNFVPRVFWNETQYLFHPKLSLFDYIDGRKVLIVGSGNLTPAGLYQNFEGYTVIKTDPEETLDTSTIDDFFGRHTMNIRPIDEEALAIAAENVIVALQKSKNLGKLKKPPSIVLPKPKIGAKPTSSKSKPALDEILIAQVPAAGGRWAQVHLNKEVIPIYFQVNNIASQRIYLTQVNTAGERDDEEVRPVIYSMSNKNYKIEVSGAKGKHYPDHGKPLLVLRRRQLRTFDYILLMPNEAGHAELSALADNLPQSGRGDRRVITSISNLSTAWKNCPLLKVKDEELSTV